MTNKSCRFIILNLAFLFCFYGKAFSSEIDSLKRLVNTNMPDSNRVDLLNALSKAYFNDNPDTSVIIAGSSRKLAEQINYKSGLALALKDMGIGYYLQGKYKEAILTWQQAIAVYDSIGDKRGVANMLSNQGAVYFAQGSDTKALDLYLRSLKMSEELNDTLRILTSLTNIGGVFLNKVETYSKALDYFLRSYKLSLVINDQYSIGTSAVNLGETYYKMGNNVKALPYLNQAAKAYEGTENLPYALNYIGRVYTRQREFEKAIQTHKKAFDFSKKLDTRLDMTQSLVGLAQAYYASGDEGSAISAYKGALQYGIPLNAVSEIKDAYEGLTASYAKQSNFDSAFNYQRLLLAVKDTMYNADIAKRLEITEVESEVEKKASQIELLNKDKEIKERELQRQKLVRNSFIGGFAIVFLFAVVFFAQRNRISKAKRRSDELLLNILPEETAEELKATGTAKAKSFDLVSVLFTDFKNFTQASELLTPEELVAEINHCYSEFDRIITRHGLEKIKTIGDSYMCAGGLPATNDTNPFDVVNAGLEMVDFIARNKQERISKGQPYFELRLGIHSGPVVAGIVGIKKFAYDIWGDTVNTASRMESSGEIGRVNISGSTYELVKEKFNCTHRGKVQAKNKGEIDMYFVDGLRV